MLNSKSIKRTNKVCTTFCLRKQRQKSHNDKLLSFKRAFNTTIIKKRLKLLFVVLISIQIIITSCTKKDIKIDNTNTLAINQKFFGKDFNEFSPTVLDVVSELKKRNTLYSGFIENFISKYGFPVWNKSIVQNLLVNVNIAVTGYSTKPTTIGNNTPTNILIVPIIKDNDSVVLAYLKVTISDSIHLSIETANKYALLDSN